MSSWNVEGFIEINGSDLSAMRDTEELIPDGTFVSVVIQNVKEVQFGDPSIEPWMYAVEYKILEGKYSGRIIRQKLKVNDLEPKKQHKDKNYLYRLFVLQDKVPGEFPPSNMEISELRNLIYDIQISVFKAEDRNVNWVSAVYKYGDKVKSGSDSGAKSGFEFNDDITM